MCGGGVSLSVAKRCASQHRFRYCFRAFLVVTGRFTSPSDLNITFSGRADTAVHLHLAPAVPQHQRAQDCGEQQAPILPSFVSLLMRSLSLSLSFSPGLFLSHLPSSLLSCGVRLILQASSFSIFPRLSSHAESLSRSVSLSRRYRRTEWS